MAQAIGHLHCLWWWALTYAQNGDLSQFKPGEISVAAFYGGEPAAFMNGLRDCGWLEQDSKLHDWDQYAGPWLKARDRNRRFRERRFTNVVATTNLTKPNQTKPNLTKPNLTNTSRRFQRPSPQEVTEYGKTIAFNIDGERFCSHYDSNGWVIGKSPMKNWKAAVVTWKKRHLGGMNGKTESKVGATGGFQSTKQPLI